MAKVTCTKCGTKCCSCEGFNTKAYKDGLCPLCQQLEKKNADKPDVNAVSGLSFPEDTDRQN